jgi:hypothetical protein
MSELRAAGEDIRHERTPVPGSKGALDSVIISLTSASSVTAAIEVVKAWLTRDKTRSIKVSFGPAGALQDVELSGANLDDAVLRQVTNALTARLTASQ